ncbi:protein translocase subunit SecD [Spongiactinospora sp. TRM90649]|uniref:protein translocase subunit SecD n=1 Tax=Spongiactinospora sp. TRM90649 TaxID=3031114 RepID=UPI0023F628F7|nr:protein translocase subunit SecD [Spongiactinospora sp. TRM90649]MDF5757759.1 protein translocase subunit SecD [Spongiactinospora sp. TRM90649]
MARATVVRAIVALAVVVGALVLTLTKPPRLGLDLRGGTQLVFETKDSPTVVADAESTDRTLEVLRRRTDALGVAEPNLARSGERRIIVELPGVQDPREAARVIGRTAQLTFHPVLPSEQGATVVLTDESGTRLPLGPARLTGAAVSDARAETNPQVGPGWYVAITWREDGRAEWARLTGEAACYPPGDPRRRIAIVLDRDVISSPQVNTDVRCGVGITGGATQITGGFGPEEAQDLAVLIKGGALPVPVAIVEQRTVGPTLGAAAIAASARAAVAGVLLTALFIITVYRLMGVAATIALACYGLIAYAALVGLGATLTLPGLAGFVLAIGMAVDANVLVFERAREEYTAAGSLRGALDRGFRNAWSAIADSNITTLLAAGLLFYLASGPVRGFGVTLGIGVLASLVSAMLITRVLGQFVVDRRAVQRRPALSGLSELGRFREWLNHRDPDVMGRRALWLAAAGALLVASLAGPTVKGLNFGVEFTGGRLVEYSSARPVNADTAREAVAGAGFPDAVVQTSGDDISVRTGQISNDDVARIGAALSRVAGGQVVRQRDEFIGPSLGAELRRNALIALGVALAAQLLYLAFRFRWTFGAAAVLALFVDVSVVVGVFAWLGKPIDGVFLAAILTVIGYSVNDKVVVFDRVRETWGRHRKTPFPTVVNTAILQTLPRTVNTGLGVLFILAALAVFGGDTLRDFAVALLIGIVVGTISSALVAGPLAIVFEGRHPHPPHPPKKRTPRSREGSGAVV